MTKIIELAADFERPIGPLTPRGTLANAPPPRTEAEARQMKRSAELAPLLRRAAAAIETPDDLTEEELGHVVTDLLAVAEREEDVHRTRAASTYYRLLKRWTEWAREYTGPRDENSPHHLLRATMETLERPLSRPRLAIILEGGMVQSVVTDDPGAFAGVGVAVIDYDTDGACADELDGIPQGDGSVVEGIAHLEDIDRATIELDVVFNRLERQV